MPVAGEYFVEARLGRVIVVLVVLVEERIVRIVHVISSNPSHYDGNETAKDRGHSVEVVDATGVCDLPSFGQVRGDKLVSQGGDDTSEAANDDRSKGCRHHVGRGPNSHSSCQGCILDVFLKKGPLNKCSHFMPTMQNFLWGLTRADTANADMAQAQRER